MPVKHAYGMHAFVWKYGQSHIIQMIFLMDSILIISLIMGVTNQLITANYHKMFACMLVKCEYSRYTYIIYLCAWP